MNEFLHHYIEIFADPAHFAAEVTFQVLIEGLVLGLAWPFLKRRIRRDIATEHEVIDAEHGITHETDLPTPTAVAPAGVPAFATRVYDHATDGL